MPVSKPEAAAIPLAHNIMMALALIAVQLFQLFIIPLVLLPRGATWGLLLLLLIPVGNSMWSLIHEAIHRLLHPVAKTNDRWGRALSILFGVSFDIVKFGHLMHHRYNRDWESEYYDPRKKSYWRAALEYYAKLCGGIYVIEVLASLLFLLPIAFLKNLFHHHARTALAHLDGIETIADNFFFVRGRAVMVHHDALAVILVYGASAYAYGAHWPWFAFMLVGRAFTISFMDNVYHYATPADNSVPAKEVIMPRWLERPLLNNNHHNSHHRQSNVAWNGLPALQEKMGIAYQQTFWQAARDQFKGPVALSVGNI